MLADLQSPSDGTPAAARTPLTFRNAAFCCAAAIAIGTVGAFTFSPGWMPVWVGQRWIWLTTYFFRSEDAPVLAAVALLLVGFGIMRIPAFPLPGFSVLRRPWAAVTTLAVLVLVCGIAGNALISHRYDLSRDEVQADFDAAIFRAGMPVAPVSPEWQPYADALEPRFMLPIAGGSGFVSSYLPVNAALRAVVGLVADPAWTSPLLAALAVIAVFGIGRRLWPDRPDAAIVGAVLTATSSQVLVTSMTSYAMTAHLALNLLWLWLFLRDDRIGHGAAIGVGFLATGLHQLIFHPLFAAPFIRRLWTGRWRLAVVYTLAYALICLFWIEYPRIALTWAALAPGGDVGVGAKDFIIRVLLLVLSFNWAGAGLMLKNILRFVAWENPMLLPLALLACRAIRRDQGIAGELTGGLVLTLLAVFVLMPSQVGGWGYRYLHGLVGSVVLLGGYGWISLSANATSHELNALGREFVLATGIAVFMLLPVHAKYAHDFAMPFAKAYDAMMRAPSDLVIIDESGTLLTEDMVRNDPFLRNRPKLLDLTRLTEAQIADLCARYSISVFDRSQAAAFGIQSSDLYKFRDNVRRRLRKAMTRLSCGKEMPISPDATVRHD